MRRTIVIGALVGAALVAGAPAALAAPEVTARSCEADGGTFSRDRGVKTCTTSAAVETAYGNQVVRSSSPGLGDLNIYHGVLQPTRIVTTTTTRTQKGSGEVSTSTSQTATAGEWRSCYVQEPQGVLGYGPAMPVAVSECEDRGLYA